MTIASPNPTQAAETGARRESTFVHIARNTMPAAVDLLLLLAETGHLEASDIRRRGGQGSRIMARDATGKARDLELIAQLYPALLAEVDRLRATVVMLRHERLQLAKLAADEPQWSNPLLVWEAQSLRDRILSAEAEVPHA